MIRRLLSFSLILCLLCPVLAQPQSWDEAEKDHSPQEVTEMLASLAFMSLRLGSYNSADAMIASIQSRMPRTSPPEGWDILRGDLALAPMAEALGRGQFDTVLSEGPRAIARARQANRPDRELSLTLMVLEAARVTGQPRVLEEHLPRALELSASAQTPTFRIARFVAQSMDAQRRYRLKPPSPEELKRDHDQAWANLQGLVVDEDWMRNSLVEARLLGSTTMFWWDRALAWASPEVTGAWVQSDLAAMQKTFLYEQKDAPPVQFIREINMQGAVALMDAGLSALEMLNTIPGAQAEVGVQYEKLSRQIDDLYTGLLKMENGLKEQYPVLDSLSFVAGDIAFVRGKVHQLMARAALDSVQEGKITPAQVQTITDQLSIAAESFDNTESGAIKTELDFDRIRILFLTRPEGWPQQAQKILDAMLPQLEKLGYRPAQIRALTLEGRLLAEQGRKPEAITALTRAVNLTEAYITEVGGGAETALRLRAESQELYDLLTRLQLESGRGEDAADTFDRYRQLSTASQFGLQDLAPKTPETRQLVLRATDAQNAIQSSEAAKVLFNSPGVSKLADTKQDYYRVLQEIQAKDSSYSKLQVRPKTFSRVQKSLPPDTLLVQLFPSEDSLYLFVATRDDLKVRQVNVKSQELSDLVLLFRQRVTAYSRSADGQTPFALADDPALEGCLKSLSSAFLDPLAEDLKGKRVVAFVPTGTLSYFPFQALLYQKGYLVQSMQVVTLVKASDLDQLDQAPARPSESLVALGDPDGSLVAAREEVKGLQKLFPASQVWIGKEATSERLNQVKAGYVHLATHGNLNSQDPLQSYLVVASSPTHNDRLTVNEIAGLNLDGVQVVTLSACSSGLAERDPGVGLELASMADAFSYAGSPTLIASLWKVADQPTSELMLKFYGELKQGKPRGEALREAQVALLEQPKFAHPFYWAPFTLMGDWR